MPGPIAAILFYGVFAVGFAGLVWLVVKLIIWVYRALAKRTP